MELRGHDDTVNRAPRPLAVPSGAARAERIAVQTLLPACALRREFVWLFPRPESVQLDELGVLNREDVRIALGVAIFVD